MLAGLLDQPAQDYEFLTKKLHVSAAVLRTMEEQGVLKVRVRQMYRTPLPASARKTEKVALTPEQTKAVEAFWQDYRQEKYGTYLVYGVTGSGKTEVYMEMISRVLEQGRQAIMLIPEIALTYQTVLRFYGRFGDRVSILHSRMSQGERSDQMERVKAGEVDVMIGPRSALFTPFSNLGLIVIDEEHEGTYKSEQAPRYHARETGHPAGPDGRGQRGAGLGHSFAGNFLRMQERPVPDAAAYKPHRRRGTAAGAGHGYAGGAAKRQPVDLKRQAGRNDSGPAGEEGADHAFSEPERVRRVCQLQGLRICSKMSSL